jgi:hypothetical protein
MLFIIELIEYLIPSLDEIPKHTDEERSLMQWLDCGLSGISSDALCTSDATRINVACLILDTALCRRLIQPEQQWGDCLDAPACGVFLRDIGEVERLVSLYSITYPMPHALVYRANLARLCERFCRFYMSFEEGAVSLATLNQLYERYEEINRHWISDFRAGLASPYGVQFLQWVVKFCSGSEPQTQLVENSLLQNFIDEEVGKCVMKYCELSEKMIGFKKFVQWLDAHHVEGATRVNQLEIPGNHMLLRDISNNFGNISQFAQGFGEHNKQFVGTVTVTLF